MHKALMKSPFHLAATIDRNSQCGPFTPVPAPLLDAPQRGENIAGRHGAKRREQMPANVEGADFAQCLRTQSLRTAVVNAVGAACISCNEGSHRYTRA